MQLIPESVDPDVNAYTYIITVSTGIKWRAGTKSTPWFTLYGKYADSGIKQMGSEGKVFMKTIISKLFKLSSEICPII